jgi:hypothetical protein
MAVPRRLLVALALAAGLWFGTAGAGAAQTRADTAAVLLDAAERLRVQGQGAAARAVLELISRDYAGTPAAERVEAMLALVRRMPAAERSGVTELLVWSSTYGAWLGVAAPLIAESEDASAYGVGLLVGTPAGFLAARAYTRNRDLTIGQARAITFGGSFGTWQGFGWAEILGGGTEQQCDVLGNNCFEYDAGVDPQAQVAAAVAGGLAGIVIGSVLARKPITAGTSTAVSHGGAWGTWFGFAIPFVAGTDDGNTLLASTLVAGDAALIYTGIMAPKWRLSESRARLISIAGVIGGLVGTGLLLIVQPDEGRTAVVFPLVGSALGLGLGAHWTRNHDVSADSDHGAGGSALLDLDRGRWTMDLPAPALRLGRARRPAVYVPLLQARF